MKSFHKISIAILFFICAQSFADYQIINEKFFQNSGPTNLVKIRAKPDSSGYFVAANCPKGIWLLSIDLKGDTLWTKTYPDTCADFVISPSGRIVIIGSKLRMLDLEGTIVWEKPFAGQNLINSPDSSFLLLNGSYLQKINTSGELLWQQQTPVDTTNSKTVKLSCMLSADSGAFFVAGKLRGGDSLGTYIGQFSPKGQKMSEYFKLYMNYKGAGSYPLYRTALRKGNQLRFGGEFGADAFGSSAWFDVFLNENDSSIGPIAHWSGDGSEWKGEAGIFDLQNQIIGNNFLALVRINTHSYYVHGFFEEIDSTLKTISKCNLDSVITYNQNYEFRAFVNSFAQIGSSVVVVGEYGIDSIIRSSPFKGWLILLEHKNPTSNKSIVNFSKPFTIADIQIAKFREISINNKSGTPVSIWIGDAAGRQIINKEFNCSTQNAKMSIDRKLHGVLLVVIKSGNTVLQSKKILLP